MNKETIEKTAVCYWSKDDDCYVAHSLTFHGCAGTGETLEKAEQLFKELLNKMYIDYQECKLAGYVEPSNAAEDGGIRMQLKQTTKDRIDKLAEQFGITREQVVDYLVNYQEIAVLPMKPNVKFADQM